jgi:hypothetical protein
MNINHISRSEIKSKTNIIVMSIENSSKHHPFFVIYKKNHVSRKKKEVKNWQMENSIHIYSLC